MHHNHGYLVIYYKFDGLQRIGQFVFDTREEQAKTLCVKKSMLTPHFLRPREITNMDGCGQ